MSVPAGDNFYPLIHSGDCFEAFGKCSFFGGPSDVASGQDSGGTASGFSTLDHPKAPYVALPEAVCRRYGLPWFCLVTVEFGAQQAQGFLADYGPSGFTGRRIDLSQMFNAELNCQTDDIVKFYVKPDQIVSEAERVRFG